MSCKLQGRHLDALAGLSLLPPSLQTRARPFLPCSSYLPVQQVTSQVHPPTTRQPALHRPLAAATCQQSHACSLAPGTLGEVGMTTRANAMTIGHAEIPMAQAVDPQTACVLYATPPHVCISDAEVKRPVQGARRTHLLDKWWSSTRRLSCSSRASLSYSERQLYSSRST